jgi:hypothetical protein
MDSIIKNVGDPYISEFNVNLVSTFCSTFEVVKDDVKGMMVRLLKTWPQFFPGEKIHEIEQRIHQMTLVIQQQRQQLNNGRNIHVNPQLFQRPATNRTTAELIRELQDTLKKTDPTVLQQPHIAPQLAQLHKMLSQYATRTQRISPTPVVQPRSTSPPPSTGGVIRAPPPKSISPPVQPVQARTNPVDLVSTLMSMGLLQGSANGTVKPQEKAPQQGGGNDGRKIPAVRRLYDSFSLQCSNCGLRFNDQNELSVHLDNHFAISSRKSKNKVLSRKWHQSEDEWIKQVDEIVVESPGAIFFSQLNEPNATEKVESVAGITAVDEGVPVNQDQTQCPVCHERFELGRDSNTDEWIYKDTERDPVTHVIAHRLCMPAFKSRQKDNQTITTIS